MRPELLTLAIADAPACWERLGFTVREGVLALGGVALRLGAAGEGITGWAVSGLETEVDGLPHVAAVEAPAGTEHPNTAIGLDHVVVVTPDFDRTAAALDAAGLGLRRIVDGPRGRMGFRRLGPAILEVVARAGAPGAPAGFWGLAATVRDLAVLGESVGPVRDAVQPGRQIATVSRAAGLSAAVAFMSPETG